MTEADDAPRRVWHPRKLLFKKRWLTAGAVAALAVGTWIAREPIADEFIRGQLENRGVPAQYRIDSIGFRSERLSNIVIGDPARPDLTARKVEVLLGYGFTGPYVSEIRAEGVRLYGRFVGGRLSFGALDKFRDPESTDPFALPDLSVMLADARARVETPWGDVGAALSGSGNLRENFAGKLALVAPTLAAAGCSARGISFYGDLRVRDVRPAIAGPLRGQSFICDDAAVTASSPQVALDVSLSEDLRQWRGSAEASIASLTAASLRADRVGVLTRFDGSAVQTKLDVDAEMAQLRGPDFAADTVRLETAGSVGSAAPRFDGTIDFAQASASAATRRTITESARGLSGSPVGPVAAKATAAIVRALAGASGRADFQFAGEGTLARIDLIAPRLTSASGARLVGSADSRIGYLYAAEQPALLVAGEWRLGGGDLPSGTLSLDRRADGTMRGEARFAPYDAQGSRLALDPVRFSGGPGGALRFATSALLSGPLADGRVERLRVPLAGTLAPTGTLALDGGCHRVGADRIEVGGFRLARSAIDLCSRAGASLLSAGPDGLSGAIRIPRIALAGSSGESPFRMASGPANIELVTGRWSLSGADFRLGEGESVTRFSAERLAGRAAGLGMAGDLVGAAGKIGAVPLDMSEIAGQWRWANGALTLEGGLTLADSAAPEARFYPLVSSDAVLRFADGAIEASAGFAERTTGTKILDTVIRHRFADGSGAADLKVRELRFGDAFQPDQLTYLAKGVVANVQGSVVGDGRIEWDAAGVTSRGTFATANTDLAAAFGPVTGLTSTLSFDDLIGLRSAPGQIARIDEVNPGIPVREGEIEYRLLGDNRVRVEGGRWPFAGGELLLHPTTLNFAADQPRRMTFDVVGVDAAVFLQSFGFENINATGKFDGTLPVVFDGLGGRIEGGRIDAREGGTLAYVGELSNRNLGTMANFAFGALRSLQYDDLTIILNGDLDGEMVTDIRFGGVGQGEGATRNFLINQVAKLPFVFNVKITAPFRQLLTSAKGFYDPSLLIEQNLPALMRAQQEAEAAARDAATPVQPPESEPVQ